MESESVTFEIKRMLRRWATWYRLRRSIAWMQTGLIVGLAMALGISLMGVIQEGLLKEEFLTQVMQITLLSTVLAGLVGILSPVSMMKLARFFDQKFGFKERSSTSLELLQARREPSLSAESQEQVGLLIDRQLRDTLWEGSRIHPPANFFWRISRLQVILVSSLVIGLALLGKFGEPFFQRALQHSLMQRAILQEASRLESLAEQIRLNTSISASESEEMAQMLEEAAEKLEESQTTEQAVAVLASVEDQLHAVDRPEAQAQAESLQNAGRRLMESRSTEANTPLDSFAQDLAEGNFLAAAQDLANLDLSQLSAEQADALAEQFEEAARRLADTNPEFSQRLAIAAQALRNRNYQAAQEALQQAAQALANTGQKIAQSQVARQAAEAASQGQSRLIQAGESQRQQAQAGQTGQSGAGGGNQGQGSSNQSGSQAGGSGSGAGESAGQEGEGAEAGAEPIGQNNQPGDGGVRLYEEIYAPQRLGGSGGEEVFLPESSQGGDQTIGQGDAIPGEENVSRVPYVEVLPDYVEAYRRAIESGQVPVSLRGLVKKYFTSLEP